MGIPDKPKHSPAPPIAGSWPSFVAAGALSAKAGEHKDLWEMKEPSMVVCLLTHKTIYTVPERIGNKWVTI